MSNYAIILASGSGNRFGANKPKQFLKLAGKTILEHTIEIFEYSENIDKIILVVHPLYQEFVEELILQNNFTKIVKILRGGNSRKESSFIGVNSIEDEEANVLIHDSVRPFLSHRIINDCIQALKKYNAVDVAVASSDTLIEENDNKIVAIPKREKILRGQTPQCFKLSLIKKAHLLSKQDNNFTDDCGLIVKYNLSPVYIVKGDQRNIKITYPEDLILADKLFQFSNEVELEEDLCQLEGVVLVVFGGNGGIGKCIVENARSKGAKVFAFSRSNGCDISNYNNVAQILEKVFKDTGRIDYIVNTAGILEMGKLNDRDIKQINNEIMINYVGSINIAKASIKYLSKTKGSILFFTSSSYTKGRKFYSIYSSCKAAIVNLTQALSEEFKINGIRVNVINPERTATEMRYKAFGKEDINTLLDPYDVAKISLKTLISKHNGKIIDVKR
ncbi:2-C-methyl-D-erythritol 4-phosphate cytidylyltransferase [Campylobacter jejuni]|uniref:2-C-methyl-D-erythritol 4-phosphate cytidylyltransferase n=1 Tax=Campylobacter jejuni TaxID=197 RepID=UPI000B4B0244|nr:2-C-methyl-D-erythritol 4-phosphate cytidylyltransferase [Campylobacter jejuni]EAI4070948.1 2-C-methyl-D-erythritol 4-phosphate cytidylyltransferase [Campylobacter jejuni]OWK87627.1 2-C-methyl-D-erythritol 4-phosphate cytidylyltransferase [Campylobacter jejuni]